jgi:hypothetical protein
VRKFFCLLLILLMFMSVPVYAEDYELYTSDEEDFISFPVYDDDDDDGYTLEKDPNFVDFIVYAEGVEAYTLEPGKVYAFRKSSDGKLTVGFSDLVLRGTSLVSYEYGDLGRYTSYVNYSSTSKDYTYVYNVNDKEVTMTVTEGTIISVDVYESVFSLVMYDATETNFQITNIGDNTGVYYRRFEYNENDGSLNLSPSNVIVLFSGETDTYTGKGIIVTKESNLEERLYIDGFYEVYDTINLGFFHVPPWILRMDLAGLLGAFWNQLLTLLPVGLVILSVFLLASLLIYTVRLFL